MEIKTDGLVIGESYTGENDRIITVLTRDYGVIRAFARGARGIKSPSVSSTRLLAYSSFVFYKSAKGTYNVKSSSGKDVFFKLREDIINLSLAQYFAQLACEFSPDEQESEDVLRLLLNAIYMITEKKRPGELIKAVVELKIISIAGYMPSVDVCSSCGAPYTEKQLYFCAGLGECFCEEHRPAARSIQLSPGVTGAMLHIFYSDPARIFALNVTGNTLELLSKISEDYLLKNTGRRFTALDFYNSLVK